MSDVAFKTSNELAATPTRRAVVRRLMSGAVAAALCVGLATGAQARDEIPVDELMAKTALEDIVIGNPDAKVTIVEYASMTCGHCADFHTKIYPKLKEKYVDSGKVRFILREFPLDNLAAAASMLARCAGDAKKSAAMTSILFAKQREWVVRANPVPKLFEIAKQAGFTQDSFNKCLTDQELLKNISEVRSRAANTFGVNATPTFFINGKQFKGNSTRIEAFEKVIDPLLEQPS